MTKAQLCKVRFCYDGIWSWLAWLEEKGRGKPLPQKRCGSLKIVGGEQRRKGAFCAFLFFESFGFFFRLVVTL